MDRKYLIALFLFLLSLFFISSNSIVSIKIQELRFYLAKEQLLNYELSSKVLKEKIRQMMLNRDDYTNEIKNNILESNIMNSQTGLGDPKLNLSDSYGLLLVNFVRFVSLKPPLNLVEDQGDMIKIQFAFFMERTRKFPVAVKKYSELSEKLGEVETNENGFIMLHHGFCLAMMGETEAAIVKLIATERVFAGTHFAENARVLINVLLEGVRKKEAITSKATTVEEKAALLYDNGNYKETLDELNRIENRSTDQNYMRARSFEELGQTTNAVTEYVKLVEQKGDSEIAKKANRRLLLIGNIYENDKNLAEYSKKQAETLGDTEVVKQVESGANLVAKSVVIEKLTQEAKSSDQSGIDPKEIEELKKEFQTIKIEEEKQRKETTDKVIPIAPTEETIVENLLMQFNLLDGRTLKSKKAVLHDGKMELFSDVFNVTIPFEVISEIQFVVFPKNPNSKINVQKKNGKIYGATKILKRKENLELYNYNNKLTDIDLEDVQQVFVN